MTEKSQSILCKGKCKLAQEAGQQVHDALEFGVLAGIGMTESYRRGRRSKGMKGFRRATGRVTLNLFRHIGCLAVYADEQRQRLQEFRMLERMVGDGTGDTEVTS